MHAREKPRPRSAPPTLRAEDITTSLNAELKVISREGLKLRSAASLSSTEIDRLPMNARCKVRATEEMGGRTRAKIVVCDSGPVSPRGYREGWITAVDADGRLLLDGSESMRFDDHVKRLSNSHWRRGPWFGDDHADTKAATAREAARVQAHEELKERSRQLRSARDDAASRRREEAKVSPQIAAARAAYKTATIAAADDEAAKLRSALAAAQQCEQPESGRAIEAAQDNSQLAEDLDARKVQPPADETVTTEAVEEAKPKLDPMEA